VVMYPVMACLRQPFWAISPARLPPKSFSALQFFNPAC